MSDSRNTRQRVASEAAAAHLREALGISITGRTLIRWAASEVCPCIFLNGHYFFDLAELEVWALSHRTGPQVSELLAVSDLGRMS